MTIPARKSKKIRGAALRKKCAPLKIESLELEGPQQDEVVVRIVASGICHTDIDMIDNFRHFQIKSCCFLIGIFDIVLVIFNQKFEKRITLDG